MSRQPPRQLFENFEELRGWHVANHPAYPVLRRPIGGWGARTWRREVGAWIRAAVLVVACGAICHLIFRLAGEVSMLVVSG